MDQLSMVGLGVWIVVAWLIVVFSVVGGIAYVAWHFISKYW